jgi:hypothetical protein
MITKNASSFLEAHGLSIQSSGDIARAIEVGLESRGLLLNEGDLARPFFDLKTGLAGDLFQKCVNYRIPLAIVIADETAHGDRFAELVREHKSHPTVRFFSTPGAAASWLSARSKSLDGLA